MAGRALGDSSATRLSAITAPPVPRYMSARRVLMDKMVLARTLVVPRVPRAQVGRLLRYSGHRHTIALTIAQLYSITSGESVTVTSSLVERHRMPLRS